MKHLVIGLGEVGSAVKQVLQCHGLDPVLRIDESDNDGYDIMHICFPYSPEFIASVGAYERRFNPKYTVIHSTVPIGTSEKLLAVHSPIRGKHPKLAESLVIFPKFIGGKYAGIIAEEFARFGIKSVVSNDSRSTEAMKLWDTTQYGAMIMLEKEIYEFCQKNHLDFDIVYTEANKTYNDGYMAMNMENVRRPVLKHQDGPIGGHCVVQNCMLLDSPTAKRILSSN